VSLVLDSSQRWRGPFPEERTAAILDLFQWIANHGAVVPELWRIEGRQHLECGYSTRQDRQSQSSGHSRRSGKPAYLRRLGNAEAHLGPDAGIGRSSSSGPSTTPPTWNSPVRLSLPLATLDDETAPGRATRRRAVAGEIAPAESISAALDSQTENPDQVHSAPGALGNEYGATVQKRFTSVPRII